MAVLFFGLCFGLVAWVNYSTLASQYDGMASQDFMSLWTGGKTIALGTNPYDVTVWRSLRAAHGSQMLTDTVAPFPMWTFVFFVPFSYLSTQAAGAVWMTISEFALIVGIVTLARVLGWQDRTPWILLLGTILFRPVFPAISNGQLVPVLLALLIAAYLLYQRGHPFASGFVLAFQVLKPNLALFLLLTIGWCFLVRRDWRALAGLIAGGLFLLLISLIPQPGWLFDYLKNAEKTRSTRGMPTVWGLTYVSLGADVWPASAIVTGFLFYLILLTLIWRDRGRDWLFSLSLSVIAATFLTPYAWTYEQVILLFPNIVALRWGLTSGRSSRGLWWAGWWLIGIVASWVFLLIALQRKLEIISGLAPLLSLGYLVLAWLASGKGKSTPVPNLNQEADSTVTPA